MGSGRELRKLVCALALLTSALVGAIRLGVAPAAADYQAGVDAYQQADYRGAYEAWQPLAQAGDATAQNALGGPLSQEDLETIVFALGRIEAALRARAVSSG